MMGFAKPIFAAFLLLSLAYAAEPEEKGPSCLPNDLEVGAYSFVAVSLALVSTLIALAFMYGKMHHDTRLDVWAKDEAFNLIITVFLFLGVIAFTAGACSLSSGIVGNDPFDESISYLDVLINNNGLNVLRTLTKQSIEEQKMATRYLYIGATPFFGSGAATSAGLRALSAHKEMVIDMYLPILASLNAQRQVLQAIEWISISILLPFAFVLRAVPFTRDFGNMMIALFFSLYIIVPTSYAMSSEAFRKINGSDVYCAACEVHNFNSYGLDRQGPLYKETILYKVGSTIPQAVFLPNIVMVLAITATMSISKALRALAV
jgi:hypothetical protein